MVRMKLKGEVVPELKLAALLVIHHRDPQPFRGTNGVAIRDEPPLGTLSSARVTVATRDHIHESTFG
jgi:hypothetical protein